MPQPPLPAPLAQRPEPGAQLLEAVRQRHSQRSLQLAQQWVHRRGVLDLQRFCSTRLSSDLGAEALSWLQELLALDAPPPGSGVAAASTPQPPSAPRSATAATSTSLSPILPLAEGAAPGLSGVDSVTTAAPAALDLTAETLATAETSAAPPLPEPPPLELLLHARAVAAVDEAFAALAQSFQEDSGSLPPAPASAPTPLALAPQTPTLQEQASAPQPLPVRSGLWPSLRASAASLGSALRPAGAGRNRLTAERSRDGAAVALPELPPIDSAAVPGAAAASAPVESDSPMALDEAPTAPTVLEGDQNRPAEAAPQPVEAEQQPRDAEEQERGASAADPTPITIAAEPDAPAGLMRRLRGRIPTGRLPRLSRLRGVMRDCVEETLALLRSPTPEARDEGEFEASLPLEPAQPAQPVREQPSLSWSLDPILPPSPSLAADRVPEQATGSVADIQLSPRQLPTTVAEVHSPSAAAEPAASTPAPTLTAASASQATLTAPTQTAPTEVAPTEVASTVAAPTLAAPSTAPSPALRPRQNLSGSKPMPVSDRPAPAPATLSDLRAWLPNRGDLPRAS